MDLLVESIVPHVSTVLCSTDMSEIKFLRLPDTSCSGIDNALLRLAVSAESLYDIV
jgi:hypothetical protein